MRVMTGSVVHVGGTDALGHAVIRCHLRSVHPLQGVVEPDAFTAGADAADHDHRHAEDAALADAAPDSITEVKKDIIMIRKTAGARVPEDIPVRFMTSP